MRVLLFVLIMMPFPASAALSCGELESMVSDLEQAFMKTRISGNCSSLPASSLVPGEQEETISIVDKHKCSDLAIIEAEIRNRENEVAMLRGFQKLKDDIRTEKERTAQTNPRKAQEAGENFANGVLTAQSLEVLLNENTSVEFLTSLRDALSPLPEDQKNNPEVFHSKLRSICAPENERTPVGPCHSSFRPNSAALKEINQLLSVAPSQEQLQSWRDALAIKKLDGSPYSFNELHQALQDAYPALKEGKVALTRDQLRAIRALPDFEDASKLSALSQLKEAKGDFKMHTLMEEFKFLAGDLKQRQQFEIQSKVSLLWKNIKNEAPPLTEDERAACESAFQGYDKSKTCLDTLMGQLPSLPASPMKNQIKTMSDSLRAGLNHLDKMQTVEKTCLTPEVLDEAKRSGELSPLCLNLLPDLDSDLAKKQKEIVGLNAIKDKIGSENRRLMDFRNFAIEQMTSNNCASQVSSIGEFCSEELDLGISREAVVLSSDLLKIALVHVPKQSGTNLEAYCEDENLKSFEKKLCEQFDDPEESSEEATPTTPRVIPLPSGESKVDVDNPRSSRAERDAWVQGSVNLASTIMNSLYAKPYNPYAQMAMMNPYPYSYYQPTLYNNPAYAQSLLNLNNLYYGSLGYYRPTMGYAAGTAYPVYNSYSHQPPSYFSPYVPLGR